MPEFEVTIKRKTIYQAKISIEANDESNAIDIVYSELPVYGDPNALSINYEEILDIEEIDDVEELDSE